MLNWKLGMWLSCKLAARDMGHLFQALTSPPFRLFIQSCTTSPVSGTH